MEWFRDWLHDGEHNSIRVYRSLGSASLSWLVALFLSPLIWKTPILGSGVALLLVSFGILSWRRKAAILTPTMVLFRPIIGKPLEVSLRAIRRVTKRPYAGEGFSDDDWYEVPYLELFVGGHFKITSACDDLIADLEQLIAAQALE